MLAAKHDTPSESMSEFMRRVRINVRHFGRLNPDECLFEDMPGVFAIEIARFVILSMGLLCLAGSFVVDRFTESDLWATNLTFAFLVSLALFFLATRWKRRFFAKHNAQARGGLSVEVPGDSSPMDKDYPESGSGLGLLRDEPDSRTRGDLPRQVFETEDALTLIGPGKNRFELAEDHDMGTAKLMLERRLLPELLALES